MTTFTIGAVAYEPKVVTIWEGLRSCFRDEAKLPVEVVLSLSYGAQVDALLAGKIDVEHQPGIRAGARREQGARQAHLGVPVLSPLHVHDEPRSRS